MGEQREVFKAIKRTMKENRRSVLATVINVYGSAYRREGAKMLIEENGEVTGMISGVCLEADVVEAAKQVFETGQPLYVHLFLNLVPEEINEDKIRPFLVWVDAVWKRRSDHPTVFTEGEPTQQLFFPREGKSIGNFCDVKLEQSLKEMAIQKFIALNPKAETIQYTNAIRNQLDVFIDLTQ